MRTRESQQFDILRLNGAALSLFLVPLRVQSNDRTRMF